MAHNYGNKRHDILLNAVRGKNITGHFHPVDASKLDLRNTHITTSDLEERDAVELLQTSRIAVYPGDWAVALVAFDAQVDVLGTKGPRTIPLEQLHREPGTTPHLETVLTPDELILRIRVPVTPLGRASTYHKIRDRESYAFALASAAVALQMEGEKVCEARVAIGGLATRPWRAREAERVLVGRPLTPQAARAAGDAALQGAKATRENRFRIELGARTVADALMIAKQRAEP